MSELDVGPIDYLAVEFPDGQLKGEGLAAIIDLVDRGIVRVLDLRVVRKELDGTLTAATVADFDGDGVLDLAVFSGIESGLLGDDDMQDAADLIEPGTAVAVLVWENTWAGPFVSAMRRAGAEVISSGRIPAANVIAALEALEAEAEAEAGETVGA
ncbi:DUF6325 family protein [Microlunatus ginsengisoli]|uniref:DUF1269 domain-containing protein n=1 Tax=Microlunatus ginsengisoli TaxID=363863 RepID=A0ABP6ZL60_9ACTN